MCLKDMTTSSSRLDIIFLVIDQRSDSGQNEIFDLLEVCQLYN